MAPTSATTPRPSSATPGALATTPGPHLGAPQAAAWRAFLEAHARVTDVLERQLRDEEDLPMAWYDVLVHLSEAPDHRRRMQDLAAAVLLSKSGLTRLVDRMERAGLVCRTACPADRRGTFAALTTHGLETLTATAPTHARGVAEHFGAHLDDVQADTLTRVLGAVADAACMRLAVDA